MAFIYAMSDMHGEMEAFRRALSVIDLENSDNMLILCGDYMPPPDTDTAMVEAIMRLQEEHPQQIIALCGNHELHYIDDHEAVCRGVDPALDWMRGLPFYYETDTQIFVHAGIDEEAGDLWRWGTEDAYFCEKFPWSTGKFLKDIIAATLERGSLPTTPISTRSTGMEKTTTIWTALFTFRVAFPC